MSVRSAATAHPPLAISCVKFTDNPDVFNLITGLEDPTHLMALDIVVRPHSDEHCRALLAISCCPKIRSLNIVQGLLRDPREPRNPELPWPANLHLPHLRKLRIDPRLFVRFRDFILSHCSNIEHLVIATPWNSVGVRMEDAPPKPESTLHRFPYLRTLDITGGSHSLRWFNREIDLDPSRDLMNLSTDFSPDDPFSTLSKLENTPSSCKLDITVVPPLDDFQ